MAIGRDGVGLGVLMATGTAVAAVVTFQPHHVADSHLVRLAAVVSVMAFVIVPILHFHQMHAKDVEKAKREADGRKAEARRTVLEQKEVAKSLYQSLRHIYLALEGKTDPGNLTVLTLNGRVAIFVNRYLNPDTYDSIIHGGKIHLIKGELREGLADIFNLVKMHNHDVRYAHQLIDWDNPDVVSNAAFHYYGMLESGEKRLLKEIPQMMQKLREYMASLPA